MAIKVLILNGPPRSGKDTLAKLLQIKNGRQYANLRFSLPLKKATHALLGIGIYTFADSERYDAVKDKPVSDFFGKIPRKIYIEMAENFAKKTFGHELFGHVWLRIYDEMKTQLDDRIVIITDCGFRAELNPLLERFAPGELVLIRLYRDGFDFKNDSRDHISIQNSAHALYTFSITNVENRPEVMAEQVEDLIRESITYV